MSDEWLPAVMVELEKPIYSPLTKRMEKCAVIAVQPGENPLPKEGTTFLVRVRRPRNIRHHRKYWAMLGNIVDATGRWNTKQHLHEWLLYQLGYTEPVWINDQEYYERLKSTDFMAMSQDKFSEYFDLAVAAICLETGIDPDDLDKTVSDV